MDNAVLVHGVEGIADCEGEFDGAIDGQLALLVQDVAQQATFDPFDDHVGATALLAS